MPAIKNVRSGEPPLFDDLCARASGDHSATAAPITSRRLTQTLSEGSPPGREPLTSRPTADGLNEPALWSRCREGPAAGGGGCNTTEVLCFGANVQNPSAHHSVTEWPLRGQEYEQRPQTALRPANFVGLAGSFLATAKQDKLRQEGGRDETELARSADDLARRRSQQK
jgi:hypothetical protein